MNKRNTFIGVIIAFTFAAVGVLGYKGMDISAKSSKSIPRRSSPQSGKTHIRVSNDLSEHAMYDIMFDEIAYLKKKGAPRDKFIEWIKQSYGIQEGQAAMIEQYAVACTEEVKQIDRRAREIISKAKAQYMNNEVKRGLPIPPPPQELRALEKERETILLRWRKKVEDSMQTDFAHFDKKVKEKFVTPTRIQ